MGNDEQRRTGEFKCPLCTMHEMLAGVADEIKASEVGRHLVNSKREFLLALRAMFDKCIERLDTDEAEEDAKVTRVEVE